MKNHSRDMEYLTCLREYPGTEKEEPQMKALVTYFSASGVTAKLAARLAEAIGAPVYEIG